MPRRRPAARLEELERRDTPTFTPLPPFPTGFESPTVAAAGDFNNDGFADLAVGAFIPGEPSTSVVAIFLGAGDGSFTAAPPVTTPELGPPNAIVPADLNGDGNLDLAVADPGPPATTYVFVGNGDGTFTAPTFTDLVPAQSTAVGDITADGIPDLVSLNFLNGNVLRAFRGAGDGTFTAIDPPVPTAADSSRLVIADFTGDGIPDVAATSFELRQAVVHPGLGGGQFSPAALATPLGDFPDDFAAADFDGDGTLDLVIGEGPSLVFRRGTGTGTFDPVGVPLLISASSSFPRIATTDFDSDGLPDLVTFDQVGSGFVLYSRGGGSFAPDAGNPYPVPVITTDVVAADFDGDANPDFAVVSFMPGTGQVFLNTAPDQTSTFLTISPNPSSFGETVNLSAIVTPSVAPFPSTQPAPTGTVTFTVNGTPVAVVPLGGTVAATSVTGLAPGTYDVTAVYSGDALYLPSSSSGSLQVTPAATATTADVAPNPSGFGQPATFTATLSTSVPSGAAVPPPTGTVTFTVNGTPVGSAPLVNNTASLAAPPQVVGSYPVVAVYSGDANYDPSSSPAVTWVVTPAATALAVAVDPNPSAFGQPATLSAALTPSVPAGTTPAATGTVTFTVDGVAVGSAPVVNNTASIAAPFALGGSYAIAATYSGDTNYQSSSAPTGVWTVNPAATTTTLTATPNPSTFGQPVTLTANLTPSVPPGTSPAPTGTVLFAVDGIPVGSVPLVNNTASITVPFPSAGSPTVGAFYSGDTNYQSSLSPPATATVNPAPTALAVAVTPNPSTFGQSVTFIASLAPAVPPGTSPAATGTVTFFVDGVAVGSAPVANNAATFTAPPQPAGARAVTAVYSGDPNYLTGSSPQTVWTITPAPTTTTLTLTTVRPQPGQPLAFTAVVDGGALSPAPTGTVRLFRADAPPLLPPVPVAVAPVGPDGRALFEIPSPGAGIFPYFALYGGDANYDGSASATVPAVVPAAPVGPPPTFLVGSDNGAVVCVNDVPAGTHLGEANFGPDITATRPAAADVNGDNVIDLVVGGGVGDPSRVVVTDGATRQPIITLSPFGDAFTGGVFVAAGDINGDGATDVVASAGESGGPRVVVYLNVAGALVPAADFFAFADGFRGGVRVALGDVNGDGADDLVVAAGSGGGPRVATFDGRSLAGGSAVRLWNDFFAFDPASRIGAFVAAGDVTGDGFADIIITSDVGGGPQVSVFSGAALTAGPGPVVIADFFSGPDTTRGGLRVASRDLTGDGRAEVITGAGVGDGSRVRIYSGADVGTVGAPTPIDEGDAFPGLIFGVYVG